MRLRVSAEVEPTVFDEGALAAVDGRVLQRVHIGWLAVDVPAEHLAQLRRLPGVVETLVVAACDDRLEQLPADTTWKPLAEGDAHGLATFRLEAGSSGGRTMALRLAAQVHQTCFVRAHRTSGMDITLRDASGQPVLRHSTGLRDRSVSGAHEWKADESHAITMWIAHLPPGRYGVTAGVDGWLRVEGRPTPFELRAEATVG